MGLLLAMASWCCCVRLARQLCLLPVHPGSRPLPNQLARLVRSALITSPSQFAGPGVVGRLWLWLLGHRVDSSVERPAVPSRAGQGISVPITVQLPSATSCGGMEAWRTLTEPG